MYIVYSPVFMFDCTHATSREGEMLRGKKEINLFFCTNKFLKYLFHIVLKIIVKYFVAQTLFVIHILQRYDRICKKMCHTAITARTCVNVRHIGGCNKTELSFKENELFNQSRLINFSNKNVTILSYGHTFRPAKCMLELSLMS